MGGRGASSSSASSNSGNSWKKEVNALWSEAAKSHKGVGKTLKPEEMKGTFNIRTVDLRDSKRGKISYMLAAPAGSSFSLSAKAAHDFMGKFSKKEQKAAFLDNTSDIAQYVYTPKGFRKKKEITKHWEQAENFKG